jgi:deaminated glutathione amidase
MSGDGILAACVQMRCGDDKQRNLERATALVATAAERGARLVVLPEMFFWRGPPERQRAEAEPVDGPTLGAMSRLARRHRIVLVAGSIFEHALDSELPFNTCAVFGEDGGLLGTYRKIHLFDVEIPSAVSVRESERVGAGDAPVCVDTSVGRLGLSICYDLRFPELYRRLVDDGAELLCVPSAFTFTTGAAHWELLLRARAVENQCWVLAPNQTGPVEHGPLVYGHSSIVDPWGTVVACASDGESVAMAAIDLALQADVRRNLPALAHRRIRS